MLTRLIAMVTAFGLGWIIYMIGMLLTVYDGVLSLIFQPVTGLIVSGVCVAAALVAGLVLRIPLLRRWWSATSLWAGLVAGASLFLLAFGYSPGLTYVGTNPKTGVSIVMLHPGVALGGYFSFLFAVANWPRVRRS